MTRGRSAVVLLLVGGSLAASGCTSGEPSSLASNQSMTVSQASPTPAKRRGLMVAGDSLGNSIFAESGQAVVTVPDRE